jgi:WD40 repeat protein
MPPEQAAGASHQADARSDVYTLGIVMYELLTGRLPFSGSPQSVLRQVLDEDPLPVRALNRDVARDLETICLKAMSKRPSDRYDTARFMAEDLSRWLQHEPIRAKPVGTTVRLWKWARRRPAAAALVGVIAVAIVSVFVVGAWYNLRLRAAHVESQRLLAQAKQMLSQAQAERGVQLLESGDPAGLLHLAEARGTAEGNRQVSESRALLWAGWYDACAGRLLQVGGDDAPIHTAMFTQSDDRLITGSDLGVYLWDIASGARLGDRMPQIKHVPLAIDGTGELLATAPPDHAPQLWDTSTGASRAVQFPSIPKVTGLCLSRDGNLIAVASGSLVWIGEVATGQFFSEPLRHGGDVGQAMAFSADGTLLVTTSRLNELGVARVWRIHRSSLSIESLGRPLIHDQEIAAVAFTPERATPVRLVTASRDGTARLWDPFTGGVVGDPMRHRDGVSVVAFSPDGSRVATGSFDGTARIWNPKTGRAMTELMRHQGPVRALQFSCNGSLLATGSLDGLVRIWNASNGSMQGWPLRHFGDVTSVSFSHDDRMLASASGGGFVRIWSVVQPAVEAARIFSHSSRVYSLALSRGTGQLMVTGAGDGSVQLWDSDSGSAIHEAWRYTGEMSCVAISPEEDVVACGPCGAGRNRIEFRDTATGRVLGDQLPIRGAVQSLAYSPDGKMLATGSANGTLQIWDTVGDRRRGRIVRYSEEPSILPIASLAFSPDQKLLAFGSEDRTVRLWDFNSMQLHCSPLWHDARVDAIAFSPDGKRLATASRGMAIRFWEIKGGQASVVQTIRSQANVQAMTFSPSGQLIATAAADGSVRLWDIATGLPCGRPFLHDATATAVSFTPDGEWLATASFDKTARIWRLPQHLGDSNLRLIHLRTVVALGAQLDSQGNVESVPWPEWQRLRKELGE